MDLNEFQKICNRVSQGQTVCVQRDDGRQGKVVGCLMIPESFSIEIAPGQPREAWQRDNVTKEVPCPP